MKASKFFLAAASAVIASSMLTAPASAGTLDQANWALKFVNKKIVSMSGNNPRVRELIKKNEKAMDKLSTYQRLKKYGNIFKSSSSLESGAISGSSVNPTAGGAISGGSVNPTAGSAISGSSVNPAAGSAISGSSVNPAAGSAISGSSVNPAAGGAISSGNVVPAIGRSILGSFEPSNYIPTFKPTLGNFTLTPSVVAGLENPLAKFAPFTSLTNSNPYAFALTHPELLGTTVNAAGTVVNAAGSFVKSTLGGIGSLFHFGHRTHSTNTPPVSKTATPTVYNPSAENSSLPVKNLSADSQLGISASIEGKISIEINSAAKSASGYTGVIVDCRGLNARRAMSPVIKDIHGEIIYGDKNIDPDKAVEIGMVGYATNMADVNISRAGSNPLVVRAIDVINFGDNPVISAEDGLSILKANGAGKFLEEGNVVFLVD